MGDGAGNQGPYGAIAELAKDVGAVIAQLGDRVTYKELMTQNTDQRREINSKIDKVEDKIGKVEENLTATVHQSFESLTQRIDALVSRMEAYALQQQQLQQQAQQARPPQLIPTNVGGVGGRFAVGSVATIASAAAGIVGYLVLRAFGVAP